jgi:hypothetical protein
MVRTDAITALRRIVAIRAAQEAAARMQLGRLAAHRRELEEEKSDANDRLEQERVFWSAAVCATPLNLALAGAWSEAVIESNGQLQLLVAQCTENDNDVALGQEALRTAQVRSDLARKFVDRTARRNARRAEEASLNEVGDQLAHRDLGVRGRST